MRKIFTLLAVVAALTASAQSKPFSSNGFFDNWSVGVNLGGTSAVHNIGFGPYYSNDKTFTNGPINARSFWQRARFAGGLEIAKQWSPIFASVINGQADVNTSNSNTFIDRWSVSYMNRINLTNLIFGYNGKPRFFELQAQAGIGMASWIAPESKDSHYFFTRLGLSLDFNLDKARAWTLSVKPAIVYNLDEELYQGNRRRATGNDHIYRGATFNINDAELEVMAGLTYHFKNANGEHYFTAVREYDQDEVDALNARINSLRGQLDGKDGQINALNAEIADLRAKLNDCMNKPAQIQYVDRPVTVTQTQTVNQSTNRLTNNVHFRIGKSTIDASQVPNVERVAVYLKKHPNATVTVRGYASKDGNVEANKMLAEARAQAVKTMLVNKYKIAANRINAVGCGISEAYDELEWNRVSECIIEVSED